MYYCVKSKALRVFTKLRFFALHRDFTIDVDSTEGSVGDSTLRLLGDDPGPGSVVCDPMVQKVQVSSWTVVARSTVARQRRRVVHMLF